MSLIFLLPFRSRKGIYYPHHEHEEISDGKYSDAVIAGCCGAAKYVVALFVAFLLIESKRRSNRPKHKIKKMDNV
jgi:hypothetical protein